MAGKYWQEAAGNLINMPTPLNEMEILKKRSANMDLPEDFGVTGKIICIFHTSEPDLYVFHRLCELFS